jgi:hypothetical protein
MTRRVGAASRISKEELESSFDEQEKFVHQEGGAKSIEEVEGDNPDVPPRLSGAMRHSNAAPPGGGAPAAMQLNRRLDDHREPRRPRSMPSPPKYLAAHEVPRHPQKISRRAYCLVVH